MIYTEEPINKNKNNRLVASVDELGVIQKPGINSRSYTPAESYTKMKLDKFKVFSELEGKKLKLNNDDKFKYYIIENGIVFKFNESSFTFYKLNLDDFIWDVDQTIASIYYDTCLHYQGLPYFEDYFPNREDIEINNGKQL